MKVDFPDQLGFGCMRRARHELLSLILKVAIIVRRSLIVTKTWRRSCFTCALLAWLLQHRSL